MTQCDRCLFSAHHYLLVCALHPDGPNVDLCPDFQVHPQLEGKRYENFLGLTESDVEQMAEASFYDGELVLPPRRQLTREEQLALLETHPLFTHKCPRCGRQLTRAALVVDCACECGWELGNLGRSHRTTT